MTVTTFVWPNGHEAHQFFGKIEAVGDTLESVITLLEQQARTLGANWVLGLAPSYDLETQRWSAEGTAASCTPYSSSHGAPAQPHQTTTPRSDPGSEDNAS